MIDIVNSILGQAIDGAIYPFRSWSPWIAMIALSLMTAVLILFIYRLTSDKEGIRAVKDKIIAYLLEIRLYSNSLPETFKAQGKILWYNFKYLGHSARPMLVMIVPMVLMILQIDLWFGYASLKPGESAIVKVRLKEGYQPSRTQAAIEASPGVRIETPPLRIDSENEVDWRFSGTEPGIRKLTVSIDNSEVAKQIVVGQSPLAKISPARVARNWFDQLANPAEPAISESSPVARIEIAYPALRMSVFGWPVHWLIVYFALSIVFGFALKGLFKVEI